MFLLDASSMMFNMQTDRPAADEVVVRLSYDEAFILSEMLDRCSRRASINRTR